MTKTLRGKEYKVEFMTKTKLDIVAKDEEVEGLVAHATVPWTATIQ